ncbi:MAG: FecR domain-containing protein [Candidatus Eisenbacteria bacterium]|uniref:FecR domain-containing protein n=1 Tax=Eiseniibacteriota bacterium TaxID=2212470 RepID=A0A538UEQ2_UNCEI|nr:MAG: FecR domain-containing protein [Candidatus Eisenbacteria bacterium]
MTPDPNAPRSDAETRARDAVRGLAMPRADVAYRARLKRDFASGRIGARRVLELPVAWHRRPFWRWALAPVTVALLAVALFATNRGPAWTVLSTTGDGIAIVDETPVPLAHAEELERRLRPGARVVAPEGAEVELASAAGIVFQVTGGTEFTVPASPGRWFARRVTGAVRHGEIRVTTGPSFRGARLHLDTPEAAVEVTGTTLAVICEPAGTCVCVFEGVVHVGAKGAAAEAVPGGRRRYVFSDGRPPEVADIRPAEIGKLGSFRAGRRDWLEGAAR